MLQQIILNMSLQVILQFAYDPHMVREHIRPRWKSKVLLQAIHHQLSNVWCCHNVMLTSRFHLYFTVQLQHLAPVVKPASVCNQR